MKSYSSPTVSIKELPVGSRLQIEGPGSNDQLVVFIHTSGTEKAPIVWDCTFKRKKVSRKKVLCRSGTDPNVPKQDVDAINAGTSSLSSITLRCTGIINHSKANH